MRSANTLEKKVDMIMATMAAKKDVEDLAISVKNSFDHIEKGFDTRFNQMNDRFDRIENVSIGGHERRIENLEDDIRLIKTKVGLKKS